MEDLCHRLRMKSLYYVDMLWTPVAAMTLIGMHLLTYPFDIGLLWTLMAGFILWTLIEYGVHRALHVMKSPAHFRHHRDPNGKHGPSAWMTLVILFGMYLCLHVSLGFRIASAMTTGILTGYGAYLYVHNGIHMTKMFQKSKIRQRHTMHHNGMIGSYGVLTTFWDKIFKTDFK